MTSTCPRCGQHGIEITTKDSIERQFACWQYDFDNDMQFNRLGCNYEWTLPFGCPECLREDGEHNKGCGLKVKETT